MEIKKGHINECWMCPFLCS